MERISLIQRIVELFLRGNLSVLIILLALTAGVVALMVTPREEEPQIVVPLADVYINAPGLSAAQVERQVATRLEKLLYEIDGVEDVYSMSSPGQAIVTVRFYVGQGRETALIKIYNKLFSNLDLVPPDVTDWVVKPVEIDDVPILIASLWSADPARTDDHALRRIAEEVEIELAAVANTNRTRVVGGRPRQVRVELRPAALAARQTTPLEVAWALGVSNVEGPAGGFDRDDRALLVDAGRFIQGADALPSLVVNVVDGTPVYLKDVADIIDGPAERASYTWIGFSGAERERDPHLPADYVPAVHIAVGKKTGTNAVWVARALERRLHELQATHLPDDVRVQITRDYGETANDKVNELVENLAVAVIIVIGLIALVLGWREALIIAVTVPLTFALTLLVNYLTGYSINRVTLFALTLSLGLVVDDSIVDVENIYRHFKMRLQSPLKAVLTAVNEVRPPIILATMAVIISFVPLFFITGMMGPYMRPMAFNVPLSMLMSLLVAFTVTPWMCYHILKGKASRATEPAWTLEASPLYRGYRRVLEPFLNHRLLAVGFLLLTALLLLGAMGLGAARMVPLKMLPFDNKNEFQVVVNMPRGTTLERTDAVLRELADVLREQPEALDVTLFSGTASPMDFNSMVRHYYLRKSDHLGDIRINLLHKDKRVARSNDILLRVRDQLQAVADRWGADIKLVEPPPGPPVIATITTEIYSDADVPYERLQQGALALAERLKREPLVVDVDTTVEAEQTNLIFDLDKEKAALSGVSTEDVLETLRLALDGMPAARLQLANEVNPLEIVLQLPREQRSAVEELRALYLKGRPGIVKVREAGGLRDAPIPLVQLGELGTFHESTRDQTIYRKNLRRVAYVFAEPAGRAPAEAIVDVQFDQGLPPAETPRPPGARTYLNNGGGDGWDLPPGVYAVWTGEGEWKITLDVFRDLGLAFGAACLGIYVLLVYQTGSYFIPLILMLSIPLTMIGIMPGFYLLNVFGAQSVGGYPSPIFFTATAMIGMIALSGIAVRNAILLIEFVHTALAEGMALRDALLRAGAVRFRAIFLTAGTAMLAALPITLDPIFSGLAWALIFGLFVSTAFTLLVIPVTYDLVYRNRAGHGLRAPLSDEEEN